MYAVCDKMSKETRTTYTFRSRKNVSTFRHNYYNSIKVCLCAFLFLVTLWLLVIVLAWIVKTSDFNSTGVVDVDGKQQLRQEEFARLSDGVRRPDLMTTTFETVSLEKETLLPTPKASAPITTTTDVHTTQTVAQSTVKEAATADGIDATETETTTNKQTTTTTSSAAAAVTTGVDHSFRGTTRPPLPIVETTTTTAPRLTPNCYDTPGCKDAASRMLSKMHPNGDACTDFYRYACGGGEAATCGDDDRWLRIGKQASKIDETCDLHLQKFKTLFNSCVRFHDDFDYRKRMDEVRTVLGDVGRIGTRADVHDDVDLTELFATLLTHNAMPLFDVSMELDDTTNDYVVQLSAEQQNPAMRNVPFRSHAGETRVRCLRSMTDDLQQNSVNLSEKHDKYLKCQRNHSSYLNAVERVVKELGVYAQLGEYNVSWHMQTLRTTIEWDILSHIDELPLPGENAKEFAATQNYTRFNLTTLEHAYPIVRWNKLFGRLLDKPIDNSMTVDVHYTEYFHKLFAELEKVEPWKLQNALLAMFAHRLHLNFVRPPAAADDDVTSYCLKTSAGLMRDSVMFLYLRSWPKAELEDNRETLAVMFKSAKDTLARSFQAPPWTDAAVEAFTHHLNGLVLWTGKGVNMYRTTQSLNAKYGAMNISSAGYVRNFLLVMRTDRSEYFALEGVRFKSDFVWRFLVDMYDAEAVVVRSSGVVAVPPGVFAGMAKGVPRYLSLARLGMVLAQGIGKHFDRLGVEYLEKPLGDDDRKRYDLLVTTADNTFPLAATREFKEQRLSFESHGDLSLSNRIADDLALRLTTDFYNATETFAATKRLPYVEPELSRDKMFFLSLAQRFCVKLDVKDYMLQLLEGENLPAPLRVNIFMANSEKFSEVFGCAVGSEMNPQYKNQQFPYVASDEYNYEYMTTD